MFCFHDRLLKFTFAGGQAIAMCPDCNQFDEARRQFLKTTVQLFPDISAVQHWDVILNDAGLSMSSGTHEYLMFESDISELQPNRRTRKREYSVIDDHDWATKQKSFPHTMEMPRLFKNYCPSCGLYVVQSHECEGDSQQWSQRRKERQMDEQRIARNATLKLSDPTELTPSQILKRIGGYGR